MKITNYIIGDSSTAKEEAQNMNKSIEERMSMIQHIEDTPRVCMNAFNDRTYAKQFIDAFTQHDFRKVFLIGAGTSHNVALVIRNIFIKMLGVEAVAPEGNLFIYTEEINPSKVFRDDQICVIGFSQHGDSISTCMAMKHAKDLGYYTIGVSEQLDSVIEKLTDSYVHLVCEEEEIGPETRGYTETIIQFYVLALEVAKAKGLITEAEYEQHNKELKTCIEQMHTVIEESIDWYHRNKDEFIAMTKSSICGYGYNLPTAYEGRLKFFETFARPCTGYEQEEQMHGPLRAYNSDNYIFMIAEGNGYEYSRCMEIIPYYKRVLTKHVFVVTGEAYEGTDKDLVLSVKTTALLSPAYYVIPFQVLSALVCEDVGINTKISPLKDRSISSHYPNDR